MTIFWRREGGGEPVKMTEKEVKEMGEPNKCSALKLGRTGYIKLGRMRLNAKWKSRAPGSKIISPGPSELRVLCN